ncbi:DivIVA domain-containing protein [Kutzneria buriramensis]|uniref:Cell wall synthesis protein Wag31 n=1 Tax=Kutzneria buriramensis TaxID=1045776 RepID=A0A3E0IC12_9PSEU|nr:DivIVA domain-containing protein [Kutzneria buriramensis]REH55705.1 DivIVA domain-containing protein [Kutzneria buriramensis]
MTLTPDEVHAVVFNPPPPGRRAYHPGEVDDFVDRIEATLAGEDNLTGQEVNKVKFHKPPAGEEGYFDYEVDQFLALAAEALGCGYDIVEVDAFLDRVVGALHGTDRLSVAEVRNVRFRRAGAGADGYNEDGVDAFLLIVAKVLERLGGRPRTLTADDIVAVGFHTAHRNDRGYDEDQVDRFLDKVEATLRGQGTLTAAQVRDVQFDEALIEGEGYDQDEVDAFLDLIEAQLAALNPQATRPAV